MRIKASLLFCLALLAPPLAVADRLDDFKEASSKTGCDSIPYIDQQISEKGNAVETCKAERP